MKNKLIPRDYQQKAYDDIRTSFANGNKHICLSMCGGSGKSLLCKMIIESALEKGNKIGFFSFRKSLTEQIKDYFDDVENIDISTLQKAGKTETKMYDLIILDEKDFTDTKLRHNIKSKYSIVMSGCPTDISGNVLKFDDIVEGVQYSELFKKGYAKDIKVLSISKVSTKNIKKVGGNFHQGQSFDLMEKPKIKKDIIDSYKKYCIGRKSLLFAIDISHAESLKEEFLSAGVKCETMHSKKKSDNIIKDFENGVFDLIINVAQISIGVDIPCVNTIIFARPLLSVPLFYQIIWRGTRKFNDDYCLVIDLADVLNRVGVHPKQDIDLKKTKQTKKKKQCKVCESDMIILDKKAKQNDEVTYTMTTTYRCTVCSNYDIVEEMKILNIGFCKCGEVLSDKKIEMKQTNKAIEFYFKCEHCNETTVERQILLSDAELKIIHHEEVMGSATITWERIKLELREECKKCNYHHRYANRLMEELQNKNKTTDEVMSMINIIREKNSKISAIKFM